MGIVNGEKGAESREGKEGRSSKLKAERGKLFERC
jgi:hypothetical protein